MPRERRAFHSRWIVAHAAKHHQFSQILRRGLIGGQERVELFQEPQSLLSGLALQALGHERSRGGRNRAAGAVETGILHHIVLDLEVQFQLVAAQRVVAFRPSVRVLHYMAVSRTLTMIEDGFLIQVIDHQAKTSFTLWRPSTSESISARVL